MFCQKNLNGELLPALLEALGFMVMEPCGGSQYRLVGKIPAWFAESFNVEPLEGGELDLASLFAFVEHFGPIAEEYWIEGASAPLKSGAWMETDINGKEIGLELLALTVEGRNLLVLQLLGQDHDEKKRILQHLRDKGLDYEVLSKTQRALRIAHDLLLVKQRRLKEDLAAAAEIQRRFLPRDMPHLKNVNIAFKFNPCSSIAGDMFNVLELDNDNVGIYLFDVSGHGAPAAMMAVSICQMLQPHSGLIMRCEASAPNARAIISPRDVLDSLDLEFPLERFDKYFTIFYGVLDIRTNILTYSNAGHPMPLVIHQDGTADALDQGGTIIGLGGVVPFEQGQAQLRKGDKIILYSDGLTEFENASGESFGLERFKHLLTQNRSQKVDEFLDSIQKSLVDFAGNVKPQDDMSLLAIEITAF